jgi:hypothetical protein
MIGRRLASALRADGQPEPGHYRDIAVRPVPIRTWYRRPGMVRQCARPSPCAGRDIGAIPCAMSDPLVLALRRNATRREPPGASVTDRGTATVRLMTVRAAEIPATITNRVTTDHSASRPDQRHGGSHRGSFAAQPIASQFGRRSGFQRPPAITSQVDAAGPADRDETLPSRRPVPGPVVRSHRSGAGGG